MTLGPGENEGGPDNRHGGADQWLYVVSGTGVAIVNGDRVQLREGTLVLIQRGDQHEIRNTGAARDAELLRAAGLYRRRRGTAGGKALMPRGSEQRRAQAITRAVRARGSAV